MHRAYSILLFHMDMLTASTEDLRWELNFSVVLVLFSGPALSLSLSLSRSTSALSLDMAYQSCNGMFATCGGDWEVRGGTTR